MQPTTRTHRMDRLAALLGILAIACGCNRAQRSDEAATPATAAALPGTTGGSGPARPDVAAATDASPPTAPTTTQDGSAGVLAPSFTPDPAPLDVAGLPTPEVAWQHPIGDGNPVRLDTGDGPLIAALQPNDALVLLEARTGNPRWTRTPPAGETWYGLATNGKNGQPLLLVHGADAAGKSTVHRLSPADGSTLWHTSLEEAQDVEVGDWGSGIRLGSYERCSLHAMDSDTGRLLGPALRGSDLEMWDYDGPPSHRCGLSEVRVLAGIEGVAVVHHRNGPDFQLAGFGAGEDPVWSKALPLGVLTTALVDGREAVFVVLRAQHDYRATEAFRIDLPTGREIWTRTLDTSAACAIVRMLGPPRAVPGPAGHEAALLVPDCATTRLLDAHTGESLAEVATGGFPLVLGERPDELMISGYDPLAVQWLAPDGTPGSRFVLPAKIRSLQPVQDGLLFTVSELDAVGMLDDRGAPRWQYRVVFGNCFPVDDGFVVLTPGHQVLIEPATGQAWQVATDRPWVLARLPGHDAEPPLWVTNRDEPNELLGLRLPADGTVPPEPRASASERSLTPKGLGDRPGAERPGA